MVHSKGLLEYGLVQSANTFQKDLISKPQRGFRRISGQLLSPPDPGDESSGSGVTSSAKSSGSPITMDESEYPDLEIPVSIYSPEALGFLGFSAEMSKSLFENWAYDEEWSYKDMVFRHLEEMAAQESQDWHIEMERVGLSKEFQEAIMDPNFGEVRCTHRLMFWIRDTISEIFRVLETMNNRLQNNLDLLKTWSLTTDQHATDQPE